jgi:hypothetical protein
MMVEEASRGVPHVRLDVGIPGNDRVVNREAPDSPANYDLASAVRAAFEDARRQLRERRKRIVDGKQ